jgi:hypothetical protein
MHDYPQIARQQWPGWEVKGTGRWAIPYGKVVFLFEDYAEARATVLFRDVAVRDLEPQYIPDCEDQYPWAK